jgi:hypothetical protein
MVNSFDTRHDLAQQRTESPLANGVLLLALAKARLSRVD